VLLALAVGWRHVVISVVALAGAGACATEQRSAPPRAERTDARAASSNDDMSEVLDVDDHKRQASTTCVVVRHDTPCMHFNSLEKRCTGVGVPIGKASFCDMAFVQDCFAISESTAARFRRVAKCTLHASSCVQYRACNDREEELSAGRRSTP
jgi:hypothetical protein